MRTHERNNSPFIAAEFGSCVGGLLGTAGGAAIWGTLVWSAMAEGGLNLTQMLLITLAGPGEAFVAATAGVSSVVCCCACGAVGACCCSNEDQADEGAADVDRARADVDGAIARYALYRERVVNEANQPSTAADTQPPTQPSLMG